MKGLILKLIGLIVLTGSLAVGWLWMDLKQFSERPVNTGGETILFEVTAGVGFFKVAHDLQRAGVIESAKKFLWMLKFQEKKGDIKKGEYEITPDLNPSTLADLLVSGKVKQYSLTVVEGWSFMQMLRAIYSQPKLTLTTAGMSPEEIAAQLNLANTQPEGYFLPDTYLFSAGTTDVEILKRANKELTDVLQSEWEKRAANLPYKTPYEALTMASIVEKETGAPEERQMIAGVFVRRLVKNMRLQTDPTVIYGMGDAYKGNIRKKDLTTDTPYNTYMRKGLPPTPIALAGRDAIRAALNPATGKELYFVAKGDGSHYFSATIEEHNEAVRKFQIKQRPKQYRSAPTEKSASSIPAG